MEYTQEDAGVYGERFLSSATNPARSDLLYIQDRADLADKAKDGNLDFFRSQGFDF